MENKNQYIQTKLDDYEEFKEVVNDYITFMRNKK